MNLRVSLLLNTVVLVPICTGLYMNLPRMEKVYGPDTEARRILMSIYMSIAITSAGMLAFPNHLMSHATFLLFFQIMYKIQTAFLVPITNPVIISNLGIAVFHALSLYCFQRQKQDNNGRGKKIKKWTQCRVIPSLNAPATVKASDCRIGRRVKGWRRKIPMTDHKNMSLIILSLSH